MVRVSTPVADEHLLEVTGLSSGFEGVPVLRDVTLHVDAGEMVAVIGSNGAGKSTLLGTLSGLVRATSGSIVLGDRRLTGLRPDRRLAAGLAHVPQGRRLFGTLSVERNLLLGAYLRRDPDVTVDLERVLAYFPPLSVRRRQEAGTLSGGEQQMVAIGRGLMGRPRLLMVDELSLGLAPNVAERLMGVVREVVHDGTAVLIVEQDVMIALDTADRGYVLENGRVALSGPAAELRDDPELRRAYLGM
jgi:branched-chain amino acid transport system ATP-binding protein